ncbi:flagellar hook-associated protein FlgK, partial [Escherichia coli]
ATTLEASIDPTKTAQLTTSDYRVKVDSDNPVSYSVIRLSDNVAVTGSPTEVDGVQFTLSGAPLAGDEFLVRPTVAGASSRDGISVLI